MTPSQKLAALVTQMQRHQRYTEGCRRAEVHRRAVRDIRRDIDALLPLVRAGQQKQGRLDSLYQ